MSDSSLTSHDVVDQRQQKSLLFPTKTNYSTTIHSDSSSDQDSDSYFLNDDTHTEDTRVSRSVNDAPVPSGWWSVITAILTLNLGKYIPATLWLREYDKVSFWGDFFSGLTLGFFTIPQVSDVTHFLNDAA